MDLSLGTTAIKSRRESRNRAQRAQGAQLSFWQRVAGGIESQRDSGPQPRVARHELPWVSVGDQGQPQRCSGRSAGRARVAPCHNPVGFFPLSTMPPKVGALAPTLGFGPQPPWGCQNLSCARTQGVPTDRFRSCGLGRIHLKWRDERECPSSPVPFVPLVPFCGKKSVFSVQSVTAPVTVSDRPLSRGLSLRRNGTADFAQSSASG